MLLALLLAGCATVPDENARPLTPDERDEQDIVAHERASRFCGMANNTNPSAAQLCIMRHQQAIDAIENRRMIRQQAELAREQDERHYQAAAAASQPQGDPEAGSNEMYPE